MEIKMRAFEKKDYAILCHWCWLRDKPSPPEWAVPDTGFIVDHVAAGFLILTSNGCAILDFYVSNPNSNKDERDKALDLITEELIEAAREVGVRLLVCSSRSEAIKVRAMKHGFKLSGLYACFEMEL